jgi:hypothetical protein
MTGKTVRGDIIFLYYRVVFYHFMNVQLYPATGKQVDDNIRDLRRLILLADAKHLKHRLFYLIFAFYISVVFQI